LELAKEGVGALLKQQQKVVVSEAGKCCRAHENEWIQGYFFGDRGRRRTRAREVFPSAVPLSQRIGENLLSSHMTQTNRPHQQIHINQRPTKLTYAHVTLTLRLCLATLVFIALSLLVGRIDCGDLGWVFMRGLRVRVLMGF
jgi:hypothetical protein